MDNFQPLNVRRFQQKKDVKTPDNIYWERLAKAEILKEYNTVDYIDFSPIEPDNFVLTCSVRVQVYSLVTKLVVKNLSRFQRQAYGATYSRDGRLVLAGDDEAHVKLFDTTSRNILRLFKGHTAPVHRTYFTADQLHVASFADDKTVRLWDIGSETCLQVFDNGHADYIRAGAMHPQSSNMFVSGGYDGIINLYDSRSPTPLIRTLNHDKPVESMLFLPSGSVFISAGGTQIRVWDMLGGCRLLTTLSNHHKTVTCLSLGSNGQRLLSGGLDRHVKIYDVSTYKNVHSLNYSNSIVSLAVAPMDQAVVAGMVDGMVSIRRMLDEVDPTHLKLIRDEQEGIRRRKKSADVAKKELSGTSAPPRLKNYDFHLRHYNYKKALDTVLKRAVIKDPATVVALITELLHRGALHTALTDRPEGILIAFIKFLCTHVGEIRFMATLLNATSVVLDVFEEHTIACSQHLIDAFDRLLTVLCVEVELTTELIQLKGVFDMLIGAATNTSARTESCSYTKQQPTRIQPSEAADKYRVFVDC